LLLLLCLLFYLIIAPATEGLYPCLLLLQIMKSDEDVRMISAEAPVLFAKVRQQLQRLQLVLRALLIFW
jgi:hypothetical protein